MADSSAPLGTIRVHEERRSTDTRLTLDWRAGGARGTARNRSDLMPAPTKASMRSSLEGYRVRLRLLVGFRSLTRALAGAW